MSDASGPGAGRKAGKPGRDKPGKAAKAAKAAKPALRGWDQDGASLSRTASYDSPDQAIKGAKRALGAFHKAGRTIEVRLEGANVGMRITGPVDDELKKLAKRVTPKDPADKAARQAARKAKAGDA